MTRALVCIAAAATLLVAALLVTSDDRPAGSGDQAPDRAVVESGGLQASLTYKELARASILVVRGAPVSAEARRFADKPDVSERARNEDPAFTRYGRYRDFRVATAEYLKGAGPSVIRILTPDDALSGADPRVHAERGALPTVGSDQVFFLFRGKGLWSGGYLIQGAQGLGAVRGETVEFADGRTITLDELRAEVRAAEN